MSTRVGPVTGPGTSTENLGMLATDLGICWEGEAGRYFYAFGDSFTGPRMGQGEWMSPVILCSGNPDPRRPIQFAAVREGRARQAWDYDHAGGTTWLPSDGIYLDGAHYLHAMEHKGLGQIVRHAVFVSENDCATWSLAPGSEAPGSARRGGDGLTEMWTLLDGHDGYVYRFSTAFDRKHPLVLYRARHGDFPHADRWQPWGWRNGAWTWGNAATPVLEGRFGELCARWVQGKLVLSFFDAAAYTGGVKVIDAPTADLRAAPTHTVLRGVGWHQDGRDGVQAQLYGVYIHPASTLRELTVLASQWNTSPGAGGWPYRVVQHLADVSAHVAPPRLPPALARLREALATILRRSR